MRHLADQPLRRTARHPGVRREGDYVANAGRHRRGTAIDCDEAGVSRAADQWIQLMQLAALALPSHPLPFRRVPHSSPMKQEKSFAANIIESPLRGFRRSVTNVQACDRID